MSMEIDSTAMYYDGEGTVSSVTRPPPSGDADTQAFATRRMKGLHGWYSRLLSESIGVLHFVTNDGRPVMVTSITTSGLWPPVHSGHALVDDVEYVGLLQLRIDH
jgi:hypothetical protein